MNASEAGWDHVAVLSGKWPDFHRIPQFRTLAGELGPQDRVYLVNRPVVPGFGSLARDPLLQVDERLWVITPWLPVHDQLAYFTPVTAALNRAVMARQLKAALRPNSRKALWLPHPSFCAYLDIPLFEFVFYDCYDEYIYNKAQHPERRVSQQLWRLEKRLFERSDYAYVASDAVARRKTADYGLASIDIISNPPSYRHFTPARHHELALPADLSAIPSPRVGYVGGIKPAFDFELIGYLAQAMPEVSFVMIGAKEAWADSVQLDLYPNVHFLGRRPHAEIPAYLAGMRAGIVPYVVDSYTRTLSPYKAVEYLMAGLETVSSDIPELGRKFQDQIHVARSHAEFLALLKAVLARPPRVLSDEQLWEISLERSLRELLQRLEAKRHP